MKAFLENLVLSVVATVIALAGIEMGLRIWGPDVLALGNQNVFFEFDPVLGWRNLPLAHGQFGRLEFSYPVTINSRGMWDAEIAPRHPGEFRVAVLGDSFTWGVGAPYGERFTEVIEKLNPAINALNFGVSGYSPIQYLLQLDDVLALAPDYVVLVFCLGNDVTDNASSDPYGHPKPFATLSADGSHFEIAGYPLPENQEVGPQLIGAGSSFRIVGLIKHYVARESRIHAREQATGVRPSSRTITFVKRELGLTESDLTQVYAENLLYAPSGKISEGQRQQVATMYKVNDLLLDAIRQRVDARLGPGHFAVLLAPTKLEYAMENLVPPDGNPTAVADHLRESLPRLGIPFIDGTPVLGPPDFWRWDAHWRPSGHRKIGELLASHLSKAAAQKQAAQQP
jgi:hypothetical protein